MYLWLNLQIFEHGILNFRSKYNAIVTEENALIVIQTLSLENSPNLLTYDRWIEVAQDVFGWHPIEYKTFWDMFLFFYRTFQYENALKEKAQNQMSDDEKVSSNSISLSVFACFLFLHTERTHQLKKKEELDSYNAVWYSDEQLTEYDISSSSFSNISPSSTSLLQNTSSPRSPPLSPASPHSIGLKDLVVSDSMHLTYIKTHLSFLFQLVFPSNCTLENMENQTAVLTCEQLNMLQFIINGGFHFLEESKHLSLLYLIWEESIEQEIPQEEMKWISYIEERHGNQNLKDVELNAWKIKEWIEIFLTRNEKLYPRVLNTTNLSHTCIGSSSVASSSSSSTSTGNYIPYMNLDIKKEEKEDFKGYLYENQNQTNLKTSMVSLSSSSFTSLQGPIVIHGINRSTVIKYPQDFQSCTIRKRNVVIAACHDAYIYLIGPIRFVNLIACSNCIIFVGPTQGLISFDRCERIQFSGICTMIRMNNCFDSVFNIYTMKAPIIMGDTRGIEIGPFNSSYSLLDQHFKETIESFDTFIYSSLDEEKEEERNINERNFNLFFETSGSYNQFMNLNMDDDGNDIEKDAVMLQPFTSFCELSIPIQLPGKAKKIPFLLPMEYQEALNKRQTLVENVRKTLQSQEFNETIRKQLEIAIQTKFKEWLHNSGTIRQVLDLVHLEKQEQTDKKMKESIETNK